MVNRESTELHQDEMTEDLVDKKNVEKTNATPVQIAALCVEIADSRKAENLILMQLSDLTVLTDYFVCCTGNNEPHIKAIADRIVRDVRNRLGARPLAMDGKASSSWVVIDYGPVIVHIMTPETRELYQLEKLWGDAPRIETLEAIDRFRKQVMGNEQEGGRVG